MCGSHILFATYHILPSNGLPPSLYSDPQWGDDIDAYSETNSNKNLGICEGVRAINRRSVNGPNAYATKVVVPHFLHWLSGSCDAQPEETHRFDVKTEIRGLKEFSVWVVHQDISCVRAKNFLVSKMLNMDNREWLGNVLVVKRREGDWTYFDEDVEDAESAVECVVRRAYEMLVKGGSAVRINDMVYTKLDRIINKADINNIDVPSKIWNHVTANLEEYDGWTDGMLFATWCEKPMRISIPVRRNRSGFKLTDLDFVPWLTCGRADAQLVTRAFEANVRTEGGGEENFVVVVPEQRQWASLTPNVMVSKIIGSCYLGSVLVLGRNAEGIRDIGFGIHQELCQAVHSTIAGTGVHPSNIRTRRKISEIQLNWDERIQIRQEFHSS
ncbi:hypothetical protein B0H11DRAFT_2409684 [Mycena galericulata]|nr:hypothetical protein B0H11DRAFT_2409684 [Mycena galericulata]